MKAAVTATIVILGPIVTACVGEEGDRMAGHLQAIRDAKTASEVVEAYAGGLAVDPRNVQLYETYIRRMADLGRAELTASQGQLLVKLDPHNGLGWAAVAFAHARREEMSKAVSAIVKAVRYAPREPFVLNTAGQLLAWYDFGTDRLAVPAGTRILLEQLNKELAEKESFLEGYRAARAAYATRNAEAEAVLADSDELPGVAPAGGVPANVEDRGVETRIVEEIRYVPTYPDPFYYGTGFALFAVDARPRLYRGHRRLLIVDRRRRYHPRRSTGLLAASRIAGRSRSVSGVIGGHSSRLLHAGRASSSAFRDRSSRGSRGRTVGRFWTGGRSLSTRSPSLTANSAARLRTVPARVSRTPGATTARFTTRRSALPTRSTSRLQSALTRLRGSTSILRSSRSRSLGSLGSRSISRPRTHSLGSFRHSFGGRSSSLLRGRRSGSFRGGSFRSSGLRSTRRR